MKTTIIQIERKNILTKNENDKIDTHG